MNSVSLLFTQSLLPATTVTGTSILARSSADMSGSVSMRRTLGSFFPGSPIRSRAILRPPRVSGLVLAPHAMRCDRTPGFCEANISPTIAPSLNPQTAGFSSPSFLMNSDRSSTMSW